MSGRHLIADPSLTKTKWYLTQVLVFTAITTVYVIVLEMRNHSVRERVPQDVNWSNNSIWNSDGEMQQIICPRRVSNLLPQSGGTIYRRLKRYFVHPNQKHICIAEEEEKN